MSFRRSNPVDLIRVTGAQKIARNMFRSEVDSGHVLLSIFETEGIGADVLVDLKVDHKTVVQYMTDKDLDDRPEKCSGFLMHARSFVPVFVQSSVEAKNLANLSNREGTGHLLMAVAKTDGPGSEVLKEILGPGFVAVIEAAVIKALKAS